MNTSISLIDTDNSIADNTLKYVKKVDIKGLWGSKNIEWSLNSDVNILSGINGSGKTTVLDCIYGVLSSGKVPEYISRNVKDITITFNNDKSIYYKYLEGSIKDLEEKAETDKGINSLITELKEREGKGYKSIKGLGIGMCSLDELNMNLESLHSTLEISSISTFDIPLLNAEAITKLSNNNVKSHLDWEIYQLQTKYLEYQLNIGKRAIEILSEKESSRNSANFLSEMKDIFLNTIDDLFKDTNKKIDRSKNEISFIKDKKLLTPYQLSSGEKQILNILLTVLVQDSKQSILFMDEPEISLHFDWQRKLIENIRKLNPSLQIILATHSPAVIMEGWLDKVSEVSDLVN